MSIEKSLYQLELIIKEQFQAMRAMVDLLRKENSAIAAFNLSEVQECLNQKEVLHSKLAGLEAYREKVVGDLGARAQVDLSEITISSLKKYFPEQDTSAIEEIFQQQELHLKSYRYELAKNQDLLRQSLKSVRGSVDVMFDAAEHSYSYGQNGMVQNPHRMQSLMRVKV